MRILRRVHEIYMIIKERSTYDTKTDINKDHINN